MSIASVYMNPPSLSVLLIMYINRNDMCGMYTHENVAFRIVALFAFLAYSLSVEYRTSDCVYSTRPINACLNTRMIRHTHTNTYMAEGMCIKNRLAFHSFWVFLPCPLSFYLSLFLYSNMTNVCMYT